MSFEAAGPSNYAVPSEDRGLDRHSPVAKRKKRKKNKRKNEMSFEAAGPSNSSHVVQPEGCGLYGPRHVPETNKNQNKLKNEMPFEGAAAAGPSNSNYVVQPEGWGLYAPNPFPRKRKKNIKRNKRKSRQQQEDQTPKDNYFNQKVEEARVEPLIDMKWGNEDICNPVKYPVLTLQIPKDQLFLIDYSIEVPPLPSSYNVGRVDACFYAEPGPMVSKEQEYESWLWGLRQMRFFESNPVIIPKEDVGLIQVQFFGITAKGTALIRLLDDRNVAFYDNLKRRFRIYECGRQYKGYDGRIKPEDLQLGLIVLAHLPQQQDNKWIRARVTSISKKFVRVSGVDEYITGLRLPKDQIHYLHADLYDCPFQIQEFYLSGLEGLESTLSLKLIWNLFENSVISHLTNETGVCGGGTKPITTVTTINYSRFNFYVGDITKNKDGKNYLVTIHFPQQFRLEHSLNDWFEFQLEAYPFEENVGVSY